MYRHMLFAFFALLASSLLQATPRQVILVRHGEKPDSGPHLSLKGKERAMALAPYFMNTDALTHHGKPAAIFVQKSKNSHNSMRPEETMKPLADALKIKMNKSYSRDEATSCARDILKNRKYHDKKVIVCFEHNALGEIARELGVKHDTYWSGDVWDQVWIIDFVSGEVSMKKIAQQLLYGDASGVDD